MQQTTTTLKWDGFTSDIPNINPDLSKIWESNAISDFHAKVMDLLSEQGEEWIEQQTAYLIWLVKSWSLRSEDLLQKTAERMSARVSARNIHVAEIFTAQIEKIILWKQQFEKMKWQWGIN